MQINLFVLEVELFPFLRAFETLQTKIIFSYFDGKLLGLWF